MSVEKTTVWENEKWTLTQYFDGVWTLKKKDTFTLASTEHPELDVAMDFEEIATLKEILHEVSDA